MSARLYVFFVIQAMNTGDSQFRLHVPINRSLYSSTLRSTL
jgi:hypothetical protein